MELRVHDVKKWVGRDEAFALEEASLPGLAERLELPLRAPITVEGRVRNAGGSLLVDMQGATLIEAACARCGTLTTVPVTFEDVAEFREVQPGPSDDWLYYENDILRLDDWVSDEILLAVPIAPLCRVDCRGLCPQCGADWNETTCDCRPPVDDRWNALAGFRPRDDSNQI
ncbi:MAG: YceD family protein [Clostridia bacterium]